MQALQVAMTQTAKPRRTVNLVNFVSEEILQAARTPFRRHPLPLSRNTLVSANIGKLHD